jgi:hypothetical protein
MHARRQHRVKRPWIFPKPPHRAFPEDDRSPTQPAQTPQDSPVPPPVRLKLGFPESDPGGRHRGIPATLVPVPEAPVNEYRDAVPRKHYVWSPGQGSNTQPETKAFSVQRATNDHFRPRVAAPDGCHDSAARFLGYAIHHMPRVGRESPIWGESRILVT